MCRVGALLKFSELSVCMMLSPYSFHLTLVVVGGSGEGGEGVEGGWRKAALVWQISGLLNMEGSQFIPGTSLDRIPGLTIAKCLGCVFLFGL